jgi:uncharacterized membrane protein (UPF0127 family)
VTTTLARIALLVCTAFVCFASCSAPAESTNASGTTLDEAFDRGTLTITADDGKQHSFDVYLATTADQQRRGLMFVRKMPASTGMLFIYEDSEIHSMWMKNTYISLDMVFAREDGSVSSVIHETQPLSLATQSAVEPVNYVLELNAGTARRLNIGRKSHISLEAKSHRNDG